MASDDMLCVYWLKSRAKHYIGYTTNIKKCIRKHNGEIAGGAMRTRRSPTDPPWKVWHIILGFVSQEQARKFEYAFKHQTKFHVRKGKNQTQRLRALEVTIAQPIWGGILTYE